VAHVAGLDGLAGLGERVAKLEKDRRGVRDLERQVAGLERQLERSEHEQSKRRRELDKRVPFLPYLVSLAELRRHHAVLDVGCGDGRVTQELVPYLAFDGAYDGIEVQRPFIDALKYRFARMPNFRFHLADLRNSTYNPNGTGTAETYRFPVADSSIDVVLMRSVFTHLLPPEVENYTAEVARVLKPGGRAYISYYLLDDVSRAALHRPSGEPHPLFRLDRGDHWVKSDKNPAAAVAFEVDYVRDLYARHGLEVLEPVHYGGWSGRETGFPQRQDVLVGERR